MSIFSIHSDIVNSYKEYVQSFVNIHDPRIKEIAEETLENGKLWPSPLLQFNPSYEIRKQTSEIDHAILHDKAKTCFDGFQLYTHQVEAIEKGSRDQGFIVTSGTGSGKSLTFFATIFHRYFNQGGHDGVLALLVYPMNALVNSQRNEFQEYSDRYEKITGEKFPIRVGVYTGQETREQKDEIIANPPTILMTNYVMLEYLMTRSQERQLKNNILRNLKYVVYDELHTYRGRQGADVGILNRRIDVTSRNELIFIGTSATMASGDEHTLEEEKNLIADVGLKIFGRHFNTDQIIGETLERQFDISNYKENRLKEAILRGVDENDSEESFVNHPVSAWIEDTIGIKIREGILVRRKPVTIDEFYNKLASAANVSVDDAKDFFDAYSNWLNAINLSLQKSDARKQLLPFKLHQFIAQTGSVYVTLDSRENRSITMEAGRYIHDSNSEKVKDLFPVVFSRDSGLDFLCVEITPERKVKPRSFDGGVYTDDEEENTNAGYIFFDTDDHSSVWSDSDVEELPDSFFRTLKNGTRKLLPEHGKRLPKRIFIDSDGYITDDSSDLPAWYMSAPAKMDPLSGLLYDGRTAEYTKFMMLSSEARSTSTTVLNRESLKAIRKANLKSFEDKILTFSDNVQDTALQSGHFNDFNRVVELRKALYRTIDDDGVKAERIGSLLFDKLGLREIDFAQNPSADGSIRIGRSRKELDFELLLYYRALEDLAHSWKVTLPNLEQVGLLSFEYDQLQEVAESPAWDDVQGFNELAPEVRYEILYAILDYFKSKYAIFHSTLNEASLKENQQKISNSINQDWGLSQNEQLLKHTRVVIDTIPKRQQQNYLSAGYLSSVKRYLQSFDPLKAYTSDEATYKDFIRTVLDKLTSTLLQKEEHRVGQKKIDVYGLDLTSLLWKKNTSGNIYENPIRLKRIKSNHHHHVNQYFRKLYSDTEVVSKIDISKDHTGLVSKDDRKQWEKDFIDKKIQTLFCSPTMELGIDIKALSLVMMRNAPPNPANYVQRSGRAGRSGQAALVLTYCSSTSAHDQHYFKNKIDLIAGKVLPPTLNLENEDLLRTHLHAMFLSMADLDELVAPDPSGRQGVSQLIDLVTYTVKDDVIDRLTISDTQRDELKRQFSTIIQSFSSDERWEVVTDRWIREAKSKFIEALARWIDLHKSTMNRLKYVTDRITRRDAFIDRQEHGRLEYEEKLLRRSLKKLEGIRSYRDTESEFYIYRYLADEGYTPGYNFPSVPIRAGLHQKNGDIALIQRRKGLAIREFGPGNIIYHGGSKFKVVSLRKDNIKNSFDRAEINKDSGILLLGRRDQSRDVDPILNEPILSRKPITNLIEVDMVEAKSREHISCEEEERRKYGFKINTYLEVNDAKMQQGNHLRLTNSEQESQHLASMTYVPSAILYKILEEYRSGDENDREVHIDTETGEYLTKTKRESYHLDGNANRVAIVKPYVKEVSDVLYLVPSENLNLSSDGVTTLQYAIERGITLAFTMEEDEIGSELMGGEEGSNIMFYENSEGSLGVLKKISEDPNIFKKVIKHAYDICFPANEPEEKKKLEASYENLLSYRNQLDHDKINRYLIQDALKELQGSSIVSESSTQGNYEAHYQKLLSKSDSNSTLEQTFLHYLYQKGLKLPDAAQVYIKNIYVNADFLYNPQTVIFIDGSVHDNERTREQDHEKRTALTAHGYTVLEWNYRDSVEKFVQNNHWCFPKVRE